MELASDWDHSLASLQMCILKKNGTFFCRIKKRQSWAVSTSPSFIHKFSLILINMWITSYSPQPVKHTSLVLITNRPPFASWVRISPGISLGISHLRSTVGQAILRMKRIQEGKNSSMSALVFPPWQWEEFPKLVDKARFFWKWDCFPLEIYIDLAFKDRFLMEDLEIRAWKKMLIGFFAVFCLTSITYSRPDNL